LERAEQNISQLSSKLLVLQEQANEASLSFREKLQKASVEADSLRDELNKVEGILEDTKKKNRKLEQENDDLERHKREAEAIVDSLREERDRITEEKICLHTEYDEYKQNAEEAMERLRQEIQELKSELQVNTNTLPSVELPFFYNTEILYEGEIFSPNFERGYSAS
jgi:chromosome segregation ATPase